MEHRSRLAKRLAALSRGLNYVTASIGATVILLAVGHYALALAIYVKHNFVDVSKYYDPRQEAPAYDSFPDKAQLWEEVVKATVVHPEPYYHWRRNPFSGKYVNVDAQGVRRTVKSPKPGAAKVIMFGGSTTWGTGMPDSLTLASLLQKRLGDTYDVYNFGEDGFVAAQELNFLLKQLADGHIPRVVIFYDGVNDGCIGAYSPAIPRDPESIRDQWDRWLKAKKAGPIASLVEHSNYYRFARQMRRRLRLEDRDRYAAWDREVEPKIDENAAKVMAYHEAHVRQVKGLGREYGFKAFFFWQPNLLTMTKAAHAYEQKVIEQMSRVKIKAQRAVYEHAKKQFSGRERDNIHFLGDVFNTTLDPIYIDWCHLGMRGNETIADAMYARIKREL